MALKDDLKQRRIELNLTMAEVAKKVGVSEATISRWESGDIANMRRDKIVLLSKALKVSPSFIMGLDDNQETGNELEGVYFSLAKNAQDEGIDPDDILTAIEMLKKLKSTWWVKKESTLRIFSPKTLPSFKMRSSSNFILPPTF